MYYEPFYNNPSEGWLSTNGVNGTWYIEEKFLGNFPYTIRWLDTKYFLGAVNFCGLAIINLKNISTRLRRERFILGVASRVRIKTV